MFIPKAWDRGPLGSPPRALTPRRDQLADPPVHRRLDPADSTTAQRDWAGLQWAVRATLLRREALQGTEVAALRPTYEEPCEMEWPPGGPGRSPGSGVDGERDCP